MLSIPAIACPSIAVFHRTGWTRERDSEARSWELSFPYVDDPKVTQIYILDQLHDGPGVRGLMSIASHYGLADIDVVGLRPVASLLD